MPLPTSYIRFLKFSQTGVHVTIIHLGRGGVDTNGQLSLRSRQRVRMTLDAARALREAGCKVLVIWTGYKNISQVNNNISLGDAGSEAAAYVAFAETLMKENQNGAYALLTEDAFEQMVEVESTSTVANFAYSAELVPIDSLILVISDRLHFLYSRVAFAAKLMFPDRTIHPYQIEFEFTLKERGMQAASAIVTRLGMLLVRRGDKDAILKRQSWLEKRTNRLLGR